MRRSTTRAAARAETASTRRTHTHSGTSAPAYTASHAPPAPARRVLLANAPPPLRSATVPSPPLADDAAVERGGRSGRVLRASGGRAPRAATVAHRRRAAREESAAREGGCRRSSAAAAALPIAVAGYLEARCFRADALLRAGAQREEAEQTTWPHQSCSQQRKVGYLTPHCHTCSATLGTRPRVTCDAAGRKNTFNM
jgi:hypothetical protein